MTTTIKLVLHPNTERADVLFPVKINEERYSFNRKTEPKGKEKTLLRRLSTIVGVYKAEIAGERIDFELQPMFQPSEWFPAVLAACKKFFPRDETFEIMVDDRRWLEDPVYSEDGWDTISDGVRVPKGSVDLGIGAYTVFSPH